MLHNNKWVNDIKTVFMKKSDMDLSILQNCICAIQNLDIVFCCCLFVQNIDDGQNAFINNTKTIPLEENANFNK